MTDRYRLGLLGILALSLIPSLARGGITQEGNFSHAVTELAELPGMSVIESGIQTADSIWISGRETEKTLPGGRKLYRLNAETDWEAIPLPEGLAGGAFKLVGGENGFLLMGEGEPGNLVWAHPNGPELSAILFQRLDPGENPREAVVGQGRVYLVTEDATGTYWLKSAPVPDGAVPPTWENLGQLPNFVSGVMAMAMQQAGDHKRLYVITRKASPEGNNSPYSLISLDPMRAEWQENGELQGAQGGEFRMFPVGIFNLLVLNFSQDPDAGKEWHAYNTATRRWDAAVGLPALGYPLELRARDAGIHGLIRGEQMQLSRIDTVFHPPQTSLHFLDYAVLGTFLAVLLLIGFLHIKPRETSDEYFRGSRKVGWLAAGLSIVATRLSSTSFVSIPAKSFATNLQYALVPFTNFFGAYIMSRFFVRFFMRMNVTSGYEYLEKRFNPYIRTLGSLNYLCYELARIGILILVPAVALSAVAGFDLAATIWVIGLIATVYTAVGGIKGVIWADTFQIIVKILGLFLASILIFAQLDGTPADWAATAMNSGKLKVVDLSWDFTRDTLWVFILFWMTDGLKSYVANQTIIQRFISTKDVAAAQRTIWTSAWVGAGVSWLLLLIGTGLFLFYEQQPARLDIMMDKPDGVFPWFIVTELPPGVVGILLSALTAAAMSSLDGGMNSTTTVVVTDFYKRYYPRASDHGAIRLGRLLTVVIGVSATCIALYLSGMASKSLFDQVIRIVGLFGGGLGGLFMMGMLTTRVGSGAALAGFVVSVCVQYFVSNYTNLHLFLYMFTGMTSCFIAGYAASWIFPETRRLEGLTVHTYD